MVKKKRRSYKKKKVIEEISFFSKVKKSFFLRLNNSKKLSKKFINYFKKNHKQKFDSGKQFVLTVLGYGALINYTLNILFNTSFIWYGFPAYGIVYYFIKDEFVEFIRRIIVRR